MEFLPDFLQPIPTAIQVAVAAGTLFFAVTALVLGLGNDDRKAALSLWLDGAYQEDWSKSFCAMFDRLFGQTPWHWRFIWRSILASVLAVMGMWVLFGSTGLLGKRIIDTPDMARVLLIGLAVNALADYISLLETRWILRHIHRVASTWGQAAVLAIDAFISGLIILAALWLYTRFSGIEFTAGHIVGAFSELSIFFFSTFLTSVWTWGYILSTWFIRVLTQWNLRWFLDVDKRPGLMIAAVGAVWIGGLTLAGAWVLGRGDGPASAFDQSLCRLSGAVCERLHDLTEDEAAKLDFLLSACRQGAGLERCINEGIEIEGISASKAVQYWQASYDGNNAIACYSLGRLYSNSDSIPRDTKRARFFHRKSCDLGLTYACAELLPLTAELDCERGNASACAYLGWMYEEGRGVDQDDARAITLYQRACDDGEAVACNNLGLMYKEGRGVDQDDARAITLYQRACDEGEAVGCTALGWMYAEGRGVDQDDARARALYERACDEGFEAACEFMYALRDRF